jgi:hypothetical protein
MTALMTQNAVSLDQVAAVPVPEHTRSWRPVPYMDAVGFLKETVESLPFTLKNEEYGLSKDGNQMFGLLTLDAGDASQGLAIGMRQSYNQSLALGIAVGAQVFVCDNLCFSGSAFKLIRKNTVNVWVDFKSLVCHQVQSSQVHFEMVQAEMLEMQALPVGQDRGYEILGRAVGEKVLTPTQATVAFGDWREARYPEFAPRNMWSLYNCFTEGLKKGQPARLMERHTRAHDFIMEVPVH